MEKYVLVSTAVTAFATLGLAILTAIYVVVTRRMLKEIQESRNPIIDIDFEVATESVHHEVFLWIGNSGQSPAMNIRFKLEEDLPLEHVYELKEVHLKDLLIFQNGISYLAPGRKRKSVVGRLRFNPEIWGTEKYLVRFWIDCENHKFEKQHFRVDIDVLQCIDPVVYRGEECASPGAEYQVRMKE